jgi:Ca2+-binding RTX toxin-like protein
MKRLLILLSSLALFGALAFGATSVLADGGSDDNNAQCQPGDDHGGDRAIAAEDRNGTGGDDNERGSSGDDNISGRAGDDEVEGDRGDDDLCGDEGDDHIQGGPGNDEIEGGPGDDDLQGQSGNDLVVGGKGHDVLSGGRGRDRIRARDGVRDRINCGAGVDTVRADRADVVARNCEHVSR